MRLRRFVSALILLSLTAASAIGQDVGTGGEIRVSGAFARVNSPAAKVGSAYMTIVNLGDAAERLIGASSEAAMRIEFHDIEENDDGVVRMVRIEGSVDLPTGETVQFSRGGRHLMLMGLNRSLREGDEFNITLMFENADPVELTVPVDLAR